MFLIFSTYFVYSLSISYSSLSYSSINAGLTFVRLLYLDSDLSNSMLYLLIFSSSVFSSFSKFYTYFCISTIFSCCYLTISFIFFSIYACSLFEDKFVEIFSKNYKALSLYTLSSGSFSSKS